MLINIFKVNQDFVLLFDLNTSSKLLERWDGTFKPKIIQEARNLTKTSPVQRLLISAEKPPENATDSSRQKSSINLIVVMAFVALHSIEYNVLFFVVAVFILPQTGTVIYLHCFYWFAFFHHLLGERWLQK